MPKDAQGTCVRERSTPPQKNKKCSLFHFVQSSSATVYLHGAHVTAYAPPGGGPDALFVSRSAVYAPPKAIRGGIPLCWPQFGNFGPLAAQHGFARNVAFTLASVTDGGATATLTLVHAPGAPHYDEWPHPATLTVRVSVADGGALVQTVTVTNDGGDADLEFTIALHTYFAVADIGAASVGGLAGAAYLDSLDARARKRDAQPGGVTFDREVDRIYVGVPRVLTVRDGAGGRTVKLTTSATLADAVVWNPWIDKAAATPDLDDDAYTRFVCVEAAAAASGAARVAPGGAWVGEQRIEVV